MWESRSIPWYVSNRKIWRNEDLIKRQIVGSQKTPLLRHRRLGGDLWRRSWFSSRIRQVRRVHRRIISRPERSSYLKIVAVKVGDNDDFLIVLEKIEINHKEMKYNTKPTRPCTTEDFSPERDLRTKPATGRKRKWSWRTCFCRWPLAGFPLKFLTMSLQAEFRDMTQVLGITGRLSHWYYCLYPRNVYRQQRRGRPVASRTLFLPDCTRLQSPDRFCPLWRVQDCW